jgi:hypothetical protein
MLWMFQRVMFNKITNPENLKLKDINKREVALLVPIVMLILWIGIYPKPLLSRMDVSVNHLLTQVDEKYKTTLNKLGRSDETLATSERKSKDSIISEGRMNDPSHNPVERLIKLWK